MDYIIFKRRRNSQIENNILQEDVVCHSPSTAAHVVREKVTNEWLAWKNTEGVAINEFREKKRWRYLSRRYSKCRE